ncbi:MAG: hypothetical protein U0Q22_07250 [Acidimicrobiales bacterium]
MRAARLLTAALVVATVASLAACGDTGSDTGTGAQRSVTPAAPVAFDDAALRPPGTVIDGAVVVQDGTSMVGQRFPTLEPDGAAGWSALLLVTGDPVKVWDAYASALGLEEAGAAASCVVSVERVIPPEGSPPSSVDTTTTALASFRFRDATQRLLTEPRLRGENRLACTAADAGLSMRMVVGAQHRPCWSAEQTARSGKGCDLLAVSQLFLHSSAKDQYNADYRQRGIDELLYERGGAKVAPTGAVIAPELAVDDLGSGLPTSGEALDDSLDSFLSGEFLVPPGGSSLIAPAILIECNSGLVAVLSVPGDPATAIGRLDSASQYDDPVTTSAGGTAGNRWTAGTITTAGGYYIYASAVERDGRSDLLVTECGD